MKAEEFIPQKDGIYISPSGERLAIYSNNKWNLYTRNDAIKKYWFYGVETLPIKDQMELLAAESELNFNKWKEINNL